MMNLPWGKLHAGLQSVLDTALDAVVVMDVDGTVCGWNARSEAAFGWSASEAEGRRLSELIIPDRYRAAHEQGLNHFNATGEGPVLDRHVELEALHKRGHEFPVELSITCSDQFGSRLFVGFLRDISERRALAERQQRMLQESDHRVKNMLAVVDALAKQTARSCPDLESFEAAFSGRLASIARGHELLTGTSLSQVPLDTLAAQVLGPDVERGRASFSGPPVELDARQLLGMSMILHELYTNAVKYGALCDDIGEIAVDWSIEGGEVRLDWVERANACDSQAPSSGFGRRMMEMSARADLDGTIALDLRPEGMHAAIRFPLATDTA